MSFQILDACATFAMFLIFYVMTLYGLHEMQKELGVETMLFLVVCDWLNWFNFSILAIPIFFCNILLF